MKKIFFCFILITISVFARPVFSGPPPVVPPVGTRLCCCQEQALKNCGMRESCDAKYPYPASEEKCAIPFTPAPTPQFKPIVPSLQIPIPTLKEFSPQDVKIIETPKGPVVQVPFLAKYIVAVYRYGVSIAFIVSIVMIMIAGFRWMTAGGNTSIIGQAKNMIASTIIGMILLLGSYILLNTVNPDLLKAGVLQVKYIEPDLLEIASAENEGDESALEGGSCANEAELVQLTDGPGLAIRAKDPRLVKEANEALIKAGQIAKDKGYTITVLSAYRTLSKQQAVWNDALNRHQGNVATTKSAVCQPSCGCPHTTGQTIDVYIANLTANKLNYDEYKSRNFQLNQGEQVLSDIMKQAGFIRYCKEWWHFEYKTGRSKNVC